MKWCEIDLLFWLKGLNSLVFCLLFKFIFVFLILNLSWIFCFFFVYFMFMVISLFFVNFNVLFSKLFNICWICRGLLIKLCGIFLVMCWMSFMCFLFVWVKWRWMVWFIKVFKLNWVDFIFNFLVLIFEKFRIFLMMVRSVCDVFFICIRLVCCFWFFVVCCESLVRLIIVFNGVCILWFIWVRKLDLVLVVFCKFCVRLFSVLCCCLVCINRLIININDKIMYLIKYSWKVFCFCWMRLCCFFSWLFFFSNFIVFFFLDIVRCMWFNVRSFDCCLLKFCVYIFLYCFV